MSAGSPAVDVGALRPPGRPRDERATRAITEAALRQLAEHGYARISMESIASEAGVARATVYRRYRDKADLITAAIAANSNAVNLPAGGAGGNAARNNYITIASSDLAAGKPVAGWFESSYPGLPLYNANPNATTFTVDMNDPGDDLNSPGNTGAEGTGTNAPWGFTDWYYAGATGVKSGNLIRWFSTAAADDLAQNQTMTFDLFSNYGPVPAGAFPDPLFDEVSVGIDDNDAVGEETTYDDTDTTVPEPATAGFILVAGTIALSRRWR